MLEFRPRTLEGGIEADSRNRRSGSGRRGGESACWWRARSTPTPEGNGARRAHEMVKLDDLAGHLDAAGPGTVKLSARVSALRRTRSTKRLPQGVRFMDLALGEVSAQVGSSRSMELSFAEIRGAQRSERLQGKDRRPLEHRRRAGRRASRASGMPGRPTSSICGRSALPSRWSTTPSGLDGHLNGSIDVKGRSFRGRDGVVQLGRRDRWGESFDQGVARFSLHGRAPRLQVEELTLVHGDASCTLAAARPRLRRTSRRVPRVHARGPGHVERAKLSGPLRATAPSAEPHASAGGPGSEIHRALAGEPTWRRPIRPQPRRRGPDLEGTLGSTEARQASLDGDMPYTCAGHPARSPSWRITSTCSRPDASIQSGSLSAAVELRGFLSVRESAAHDALAAADRPQRPGFEERRPRAALVRPRRGPPQRLALRPPTPRRCSRRKGPRTAGSTCPGASIDVALSRGFPGRGARLRTYLTGAVGGRRRNHRLGNVPHLGRAGSLRAPGGGRSSEREHLLLAGCAGDRLPFGEAEQRRGAVSGGVEMERMVPKSHMSARITDVNVRSPGDRRGRRGRRPDAPRSAAGAGARAPDPLADEVHGGRGDRESLLDFSRRPPTPKVLARAPCGAIRPRRAPSAACASRTTRRTDLKGRPQVTATSRSMACSAASYRSRHRHLPGNEFQIEQGVLTSPTAAHPPSLTSRPLAGERSTRSVHASDARRAAPFAQLRSDARGGDLGSSSPSLRLAELAAQHVLAPTRAWRSGSRRESAPPVSAERGAVHPKNPILRDRASTSQNSRRTPPAGADGPVPVGAAHRSARPDINAGPEDAPVPRRGRLPAFGLHLRRFQLDNEHSTTAPHRFRARPPPEMGGRLVDRHLCALFLAQASPQSRRAWEKSCSKARTRSPSGAGGGAAGQLLDAATCADAVRALHASARFSRVRVRRAMGDGRVRLGLRVTGSRSWSRSASRPEGPAESVLLQNAKSSITADSSRSRWGPAVEACRRRISASGTGTRRSLRAQSGAGRSGARISRDEGPPRAFRRCGSRATGARSATSSPQPSGSSRANVLNLIILDEALRRVRERYRLAGRLRPWSTGPCRGSERERGAYRGPGGRGSTGALHHLPGTGSPDAVLASHLVSDSDASPRRPAAQSWRAAFAASTSRPVPPRAVAERAMVARDGAEEVCSPSTRACKCASSGLVITGNKRIPTRELRERVLAALARHPSADPPSPRIGDAELTGLMAGSGARRPASPWTPTRSSIRWCTRAH